MVATDTLQDLTAKARRIRRLIITMLTEAGSGHAGGSLSAVEILCALYFGILRHDPKRPDWPDRDRFVLSKGHATPVLYSVLAEAGYFPAEELLTFRKLNSRLQGHTKISTAPGIEMSAGSLGQGLSYCIGQLFAARLDGRDYRAYCLLGDGECQEGQVWEALMCAGYYRLDRLVAVIDRNGIQNDWYVKDTMELEPLDEKLRAFGWHVTTVDGHDIGQLIDAFEETKTVAGQPSAIIARTVKGKGVSFMENNPDWHGKAPSKEEAAQALAEIGE
ncbi:MAG: transketolase [Chloroflexi bacterium]|nr:transketolase [Chloroflexota bacterium]